MSLFKIHKVFLVGLLSLLLALTSCREPMHDVSVVPTNDVRSLDSPVATPTVDLQSIIPAPGEDTGTVYGVIVDATGEPAFGLPVYLGTYDGLLAEISLNNSPRTVTSDSGLFVFPEIPPNDDSFQYVVGIVMGSDSGTIIKEPGNSSEILVFDVEAGKLVDLGVLPVDF